MKVENTSIYHRLNEITKEKESSYARGVKRQRALLFITFLIVLFSSMNMLSASFFEKYSFFKKHVVFLGVGYFISIFSAAFFRKNLSYLYEKFENRWVQYFLLIFSFGILVTVGCIAPTIKGAKVWLRVGGFSIQPAEILKIAFILNLSNFFKKRTEDNSKARSLLIGTSIILLCYIFPIIYFQNDTGTALHYCAITIFMLFMTKLNKRWILGGIGVAGGSLAAIIYCIYAKMDVEGMSYTYKRIKSYMVGLLEKNYDSDISHQVGQGLIAFGTGGIGGKGYGNGVQKYSYIPEVHTDFIMSSFGEEFGFIGMGILSFTFYFLFHNIMEVGEACSNLFGKYLVTGIAGMIITQFFINLFVATGLFPVFGIPMPFFSSGGTSILTLFLGMALVYMVNNGSLTKR